MILEGAKLEKASFYYSYYSLSNLKEESNVTPRFLDIIGDVSDSFDGVRGRQQGQLLIVTSIQLKEVLGHPVLLCHQGRK